MKATLILFLFISILNNAEFKQNKLTQIEDMEDPILSSSPRKLKSEASNALKYIFGISFDFGTKVYNEDYVLISNKNLKVTAKLSSSCIRSIKFGANSGVISIKEGKINADKFFEFINRDNLYTVVVKRFDLAQKIIYNFFSKFKDVIPNGSLYFNFSLNLVEFEFIFIPKGEKICDGKLIVRLIPFKK